MTYHIITIGCQMNKADSERAAAHLEALGYTRSGDKNRANLVVVNTCGVRQSAEDRVYGIIPGIKGENPNCHIVVTGCLAGREDVKRRLKGLVDKHIPISEIFNYQFSIFNKYPISNIQYPNKSKRLESDYLKVKPKYASKTRAYVPIGNGCNNFCSYCVVPYARGREVYRPAEEILNEVCGLVDKGYKEVILIAQNVNSYSSRINPELLPNLIKSQNKQLKNNKTKKLNYSTFDIRHSKIINFSDLLKLVNNLPGDFKIKFATSHPKDMTDKLIRTIAECDKVVKEIHLPVQSGDDEILKKMNRRYTAEHYKKLIAKIRKMMPEAKISTDVIVGFPSETKRQFNNTVKLFRQVKFDNAYIARYSPRPGTAAAKLPDNVKAAEKKRRWQALNNELAIMN